MVRIFATNPVANEKRANYFWKFQKYDRRRTHVYKYNWNLKNTFFYIYGVRFYVDRHGRAQMPNTQKPVV